MIGQLVGLVWRYGLKCIFAELDVDCLACVVADAVLGLDLDGCGLLLKAIDLCELEELTKKLFVFVEDYLCKLLIFFESCLLELCRQDQCLIGPYRVFPLLKRKQGTLIG